MARGVIIAVAGGQRFGVVYCLDGADHTNRFVQSGSLTSASCPASGVTFTCVSIGRAGAWSPHDLHFSKDGKTAYTADVGDDTVIVDVGNVLSGQITIIGIAPNHIDAVDNPNNVAIFTGGVRFYRPLRIGHVVEVEARLLHTGRTSMHVGVHVRSGDPAEGADGMELTTYCRTIFVGIDEHRRAVPCPAWVPANDEDRALDAHAVELVRIRDRFGD